MIKARKAKIPILVTPKIKRILVFINRGKMMLGEIL
jgi:hypothetical protein